MLIVIAYGAAEAFLRVSDDDPDLNTALLLSTVAPAGWQATASNGLNFKEAFVTPCLRTPLLDGVSVRNRGAVEYVRPSGSLPGTDLLIMQTSAGNARAIMDDVIRDTENDCQRGVTVGTVSSAQVEPLDLPNADQALLVSYDQETPSRLKSMLTLVLRQGEYVARLDHEISEDSQFVADDLVALAVALSERIERPPTEAEFMAAGVETGPSRSESYALRVKEMTSDIFTLSGRFPIAVGMSAFCGSVAVLFILGARMSRIPSTSVLSEARTRDGESRSLLTQFPTTLDNGNGSSGRAPSTSVTQIGAGPSYDVDDEPEPEPVAPPPVVDFPQKSIEEKLSILKEARLKEPRREHRAVREIEPSVNWTDEISKAETAAEAEPVAPPAGPVSHKALLKKLRSSESEN